MYILRIQYHIIIISGTKQPLHQCRLRSRLCTEQLHNFPLTLITHFTGGIVQNFFNIFGIILYKFIKYCRGWTKYKICVYSCSIFPKLSLPEIYYRTTFTCKQSEDHGYINYVIQVFKIMVNIHKHGDSRHVKAHMTKKTINMIKIWNSVVK